MIPVSETFPANSDGRIDTDKQEKGSFEYDLQIFFRGDVHCDKVFSPPFRDVIAHFCHGIKMYISLAVHLQRVHAIRQLLNMIAFTVTLGRRMPQTETRKVVIGNEEVCYCPLA